jgi:hypothetical protein
MNGKAIYRGYEEMRNMNRAGIWQRGYMEMEKDKAISMQDVVIKPGKIIHGKPTGE